jgi:hypothetical protein
VPRPASRRLGCEFGRVAGDWRLTGAASGAVRADGGEDGVPDWDNHFCGFCGKWRTAQNSPPGFCAARTYRWSFYSARSASGRRLRPSIGAYWFKFSKSWRTARAKTASEQHLPSHLQFSTTISDCIRMYISYLWPLWRKSGRGGEWECGYLTLCDSLVTPRFCEGPAGFLGGPRNEI